jgi:hypothetical protein
MRTLSGSLLASALDNCFCCLAKATFNCNSSSISLLFSSRNASTAGATALLPSLLIKLLIAIDSRAPSFCSPSVDVAPGDTSSGSSNSPIVPSLFPLPKFRLTGPGESFFVTDVGGGGGGRFLRSSDLGPDLGVPVLVVLDFAREPDGVRDFAEGGGGGGGGVGTSAAVAAGTGTAAGFPDLVLRGWYEDSLSGSLIVSEDVIACS